ncbi:OB-fold protein [Enterobacter cloacae complex sp. CARB60]|uniref:OB-fold protein n=1 Tax=Enterobacter cloacae complex sp. CARB60 TaxID=3119569 RepID=UPI002F41BEDB
MKKIIVLPLFICAFSSVASGAVSGEIQPYPDYLSTYVKTLVTASCDHVLSDDGTNSIDRAIKSVSASATKGMSTDTESYYAVYNSIVFGAEMGDKLKDANKQKLILVTKDKIGIDSCGGVGAYALIQKDFRKMTLTGLMPVAPQAGVVKPKATSSDERVYRTKAKDLAELYKANEVAADDKIGGRKVEVTGTVQDITKNFANDVVLKLESGNRFMPVSLSMADSEKAQASKLNKGQKITVTCEKMQLFIGAPSGGKCTFN